MSARDVGQREVKYKQTGRCKTPSTPRGSSQDRLQQRLKGSLSHGGADGEASPKVQWTERKDEEQLGRGQRGRAPTQISRQKAPGDAGAAWETSGREAMPQRVREAG